MAIGLAILTYKSDLMGESLENKFVGVYSVTPIRIRIHSNSRTSSQTIFLSDFYLKRAPYQDGAFISFTRSHVAIS